MQGSVAGRPSVGTVADLLLGGPDGRPALRCRDCFQLRPNILAAATPQYRLTQPVAQPEVAHASGIQRAWEELDFPITDADLFDLSDTPAVIQ